VSQSTLTIYKSADSDEYIKVRLGSVNTHRTLIVVALSRLMNVPCGVVMPILCYVCAAPTYVQYCEFVEGNAYSNADRA